MVSFCSITCLCALPPIRFRAHSANPIMVVLGQFARQARDLYYMLNKQVSASHSEGAFVALQTEIADSKRELGNCMTAIADETVLQQLRTHEAWQQPCQRIARRQDRVSADSHTQDSLRGLAERMAGIEQLRGELDPVNIVEVEALANAMQSHGSELSDVQWAFGAGMLAIIRGKTGIEEAGASASFWNSLRAIGGLDDLTGDAGIDKVQEA